MAIYQATPSWKPMALSPHAIIADPRYQPRIGLHEPTVARYVAAMGRGETFPPISVAAIGRGKLNVIDGFHRLEAALRSSWPSIPAQVTKMTEAAAVAYALDANAKHGLSLTRKDKRRIFARYLEMGFHLEASGRVKSLRTIRADLADIAYPATIANWLRKANIQPSDADEIEPFRFSQNQEEDDTQEEIEDMQALQSFIDHGLAQEALFASMASAEAQLKALTSLRDLIDRLGDKEHDLEKALEI